MPADAGAADALLFAFLLTLARVSGVLALAPLPGFAAGPRPARIVLALTITLLLFPDWPRVKAPPNDMGALLMALLPELAAGVTIGLGVAFILEVFVFAAQVLSLNAGFSFAQTIDPTTQAESGVLLVFAQLAGGLIFCALGLDREVIRAMADSLPAQPAAGTIHAAAAAGLLRRGGEMLALALRLAMPSVALLVLVDLALGLLGRLNAQLQLLTLAFPIKMTQP